MTPARRWLTITISIFIFSVSWVLSVAAQGGAHQQREPEIIQITARTGYLLDQTGKATIEQVTAPPLDGRFKPIGRSFLPFGDVKGALWLKVPVPRLKIPMRWVLELSKGWVEKIDFFVPKLDGSWRVVNAGAARPIPDQLVTARVPALRLPRELPHGNFIYIRLESRFPLGMSINYMSAQEFWEHYLEDSYLCGALFATPFVLGLFNLFLFAALRDRTYLYYVVFMFSLLGYLLILHGQAHMAGLLPHQALVVVFGALIGAVFVFGGLFTRHFLFTKEQAPVWNTVLWAFISLGVLRILVSLAGFHRFGNQMSQVMGLIVPFGAIALGVHCLRMGFLPARFYLSAWVVLSCAVFWHVLVSLGILPWSGISSLVLPMGWAAEALLLSFALADRISALRRESQHLRESTKQLWRLSNIDGLTGLFNLRYFKGTLQSMEKACRGNGEPLSLLMMDLDSFKAFNDTYGHVEGDKVLVGLADVLRASLRDSDVACRYGGEEFTVLLSKTGLEPAAEVAERVRQGFKQKTFSPDNGGSVRATVSIGVACLKPGEMGQDLVRRADEALYQAKRMGKDRVVVTNGGQ